MLATALLLSLSQVRPLQPKPLTIPQETFQCFFSNLRLDISSGLFPSCFPTKPCMHLSSPQTYRRQAPTIPFFFNFSIELYRVRSIKRKVPHCSASSSSLFLLSHEPKCLSELPVLENPKPLFFLTVKTKFHTLINC